MSKEPVVTGTKAVANVNKAAEDIWGATTTSAQNIVLPKLRPLTGTSKLVQAGEAKAGDMVETLTNEVLADYENSVQAVPFHREYLWVEYEKVGTSKKYRGSYEANASNEKLPWKFQQDGAEWERDYIIRVYVLLTDDLKTGSGMPHFVDFSRTGNFNGRKLDTMMYVTNRAAGLVPPAFTIQLKSEKKTNSDNTWAVPSFSKDRKATKEEIAVCAEWLQTIASGKAVADEGVMDEETLTTYNGEAEGEQF